MQSPDINHNVIFRGFIKGLKSFPVSIFISKLGVTSTPLIECQCKNLPYTKAGDLRIFLDFFVAVVVAVVVVVVAVEFVERIKFGEPNKK